MAEFKVIAGPRLSMIRYIQVLLHDVVVSHLYNRQQTLEASVHITVVGIVFEAYNTVFEGG